ncbi:MAG: hypothetical protein LBJ38_00105, partial [Oscillospiraceae bacterium]|nr:hypothetical protein [Oscillospiraceae bacterium]
LADLQAADFALCVLQNGWHVHLPQTYRNLGATDLPTEWPILRPEDAYGVRTFGLQSFGTGAFEYTDIDGRGVTTSPHWSWASTTNYWNDAPFLLCQLWGTNSSKLPPVGTTITEYEEMREIEVPPLLYARGLLTILQQTAGCWAPKSHAEAEADFMAALGFWHNWRVLYKQNIARNIALARGEIISGGTMSDGFVRVRSAAGTEAQFDLPGFNPMPWQQPGLMTPAQLQTMLLHTQGGPIISGFVAEQQIPSQWAQQELA